MNMGKLTFTLLENEKTTSCTCRELSRESYSPLPSHYTDYAIVASLIMDY
jgi:hypothetical protein